MSRVSDDRYPVRPRIEQIARGWVPVILTAFSLVVAVTIWAGDRADERDIEKLRYEIVEIRIDLTTQIAEQDFSARNDEEIKQRLGRIEDALTVMGNGFAELIRRID